MKNISMSFEFIFSMIEDIQDLAKFNNNQAFSLANDFFNIRSFLDDVGVLFEEQCKFKNLGLKKEISSNIPVEIYSD